MTFDDRGDLERRSVSFEDIAQGYGEAIGKAVDLLIDQGADKLIGEAWNALPGDAKDTAIANLKLLARSYLPAARTLDKMPDAIARWAGPASLLLLVAESVGKSPEDIGIRFVDPQLTFEEARRYYRWRGSLACCYPGTALTLASKKRNFTVYAPDRLIPFMNTMKISVSNKAFTDPNVKR